LIAVGIAVERAELGRYGPATADAVRTFQDGHGLIATGVCDHTTWSALVEAGYRLGDRLLYLRSPMLRGDDVLDLQHNLSALGFHAGRPDGIFGPQTSDALVQFQRNVGLTTDAVCGPEVCAALARLGGRTSTLGVAGVREREHLRATPSRLAGRRIVVGHSGGLDALAASIGRLLQDDGATVALLQHPDASVQARDANAFGAEAFLGLDLTDHDRTRVAFYETPGFRSAGGAHLADLVRANLSVRAGLPCADATGLRLPLLRETRMPAVAVMLGSPSLVVEHSGRVASALVRALKDWVASPVPDV
jgi:N-acetylmuramoyl-L-alanine amidase